MSSAALLVDQLHGLVESLSSLDPAACTADELQQLLVRLEGERARLAVATASVACEWQQRGEWQADGSLRPQLALGRECRRDHEVVKRELRRARLLAQLPHTRRAVLEGRLSLDHVDLLARYATAARLELFQACEEWLVGQCSAHALFDDARRAVQYWAAWADDQLGRAHERPAASTLYMSQSHTTGEWWLDGHLHPVDGEIVSGELRRLERQLLLDDRREGVHRTPAQRRAAALVRMATRSVNATGVTARPLFEVIVGDETARHLCQLASGTVVHPDDLEPHIDDAVMEAFLFGGQNTIVAVSKQRTFRGALRRAIQVRDRRCQHSSVCPTPAVDCDVDHRTPAARGGPTSQFNGAVECVAHNRLAHLHDDPTPRPEHPLGPLDELRTRLRWRHFCEDVES